jgi:hypothetical protein
MVGENCIMKSSITCTPRQIQYNYNDQSKADEKGRTCKKRNAYRILVVKSAGKRPLGRPKGRWVDNVKMYLKKIGWGGIDWIDLAQDRGQWRVNTVMNLKSSIKCWGSS